MTIIQNLIILGLILNIAGVPLAIAEPSSYETVTLSFVTAYTSHPLLTDSTPFTTAANTKTRDGVLAANSLPFGTVVIFPELFPDKEFVVEDRMNKRYNDVSIADIWMETMTAAQKFGVKRNVKMVIVSQPTEVSLELQNQLGRKTPKKPKSSSL